MLMNEIHCPDCDTRDLKVHTVYTVQNGETRRLYYARPVNAIFQRPTARPWPGCGPRSAASNRFWRR